MGRIQTSSLDAARAWVARRLRRCDEATAFAASVRGETTVVMGPPVRGGTCLERGLHTALGPCDLGDLGRPPTARYLRHVRGPRLMYGDRNSGRGFAALTLASLGADIAVQSARASPSFRALSPERGRSQPGDLAGRRRADRHRRVRLCNAQRSGHDLTAWRRWSPRDIARLANNRVLKPPRGHRSVELRRGPPVQLPRGCPGEPAREKPRAGELVGAHSAR